MNTPRTLQTKRSRPKSRFRRLPAVTRGGRKRKQRASTTASPEDLGEVPGVGVPLALVVILLLHVAAIAGIWLHNRWSSSADLVATKVELQEVKRPGRISELKPYTVEAGDTPESIARDHGVTVGALLNVNEGIEEYQSGWVINLPPVPPAPAPAVAEVLREPAPVEVVPAFTYNERPLIQTADDEVVEGSTPGELMKVGPETEAGTPEAEAGRTEEAVLIRPVAPVRETKVPASSTRSHIVAKGQTFWSISRTYGISVDALERANPGVSATSLKIGAKLVIPPAR
jgi:LysM repeat protein